MTFITSVDRKNQKQATGSENKADGTKSAETDAAKDGQDVENANGYV